MRLGQPMPQRDPSVARLQGVHGPMWTVQTVHQHFEGTQVFASKLLPSDTKNKVKYSVSKSQESQEF